MRWQLPFFCIDRCKLSCCNIFCRYSCRRHSKGGGSAIAGFDSEDTTNSPQDGKPSNAMSLICSEIHQFASLRLQRKWKSADGHSNKTFTGGTASQTPGHTANAGKGMEP